MNCHLTLQDHLIKVSGDLMEESSSLYVTPPHSWFGGHRYCVSGDIMLLIYHVTSCDHAIKEFFGFKEESSSLYIPTCQV